MPSERDGLLPSVMAQSVTSQGISPSSSTSSLQDSSLSYTSCKAAVFLTVNAALGAGLLNMPYAFQSGGGLLAASLTQLVFVIIIMVGMFILTYCTHVSGARSFQELVTFYAGQRAANITSVCIVMYSYGACLTFIVIIGDQVDRVLASVYGPDFCHVWYLNRAFTMSLISLILILPLSFSKSIDFLKYSSSCGVLVVGYIIFLSFYEWLHLQDVELVFRSAPGSSSSHHKQSITRLIPAVVFAYQCHLSWVPTYAGMREPCHSKRLMFTIVVSFLICLAAYEAIAVFGLLTFADLLDSDLMLNYDASKPMVLIGIIAIAFKTITTYPLILFPARLAMDDAVVKLLKIENPQRSEMTRRIPVVLIWFFSTLVLAIFVPDISSTINLMGTLAVLFTLLIPGVCLMSAANMMERVIVFERLLLMNGLGICLVLFASFIFGLTLSELVILTPGQRIYYNMKLALVFFLVVVWSPLTFSQFMNMRDVPVRGFPMEHSSRVGSQQHSSGIEGVTTPRPATTAKPVKVIDGGDTDPNREADAVLKLLRKPNTKDLPGTLDLKMGCFTEAPETGGSEDGSQKVTGDTEKVTKPNLQSLLMQVVGQVASYNERMNQEGDSRKAIVKMLESYIKNQKDSLKKSESILNEYRVTLPKQL